jgi:hypothetical protein
LRRIEDPLRDRYWLRRIDFADAVCSEGPITIITFGVPARSAKPMGAAAQTGPIGERRTVQTNFALVEIGGCGGIMCTPRSGSMKKGQDMRPHMGATYYIEETQDGRHWRARARECPSPRGATYRMKQTNRSPRTLSTKIERCYGRHRVILWKATTQAKPRLRHHRSQRRRVCAGVVQYPLGDLQMLVPAVFALGQGQVIA